VSTRGSRLRHPGCPRYVPVPPKLLVSTVRCHGACVRELLLDGLLDAEGSADPGMPLRSLFAVHCSPARPRRQPGMSCRPHKAGEGEGQVAADWSAGWSAQGSAGGASLVCWRGGGGVSLPTRNDDSRCWPRHGNMHGRRGDDAHRSRSSLQRARLQTRAMLEPLPGSPPWQPPWP
jgi:hypothetical protein